jgi:FAD/FMN-containing dehydrogenase
MGALAAATLEKGFLPAVVPQFRKFTVSGLINGEGIQSSCHRYGIFTQTLDSVEMVTADGHSVTASRSHNHDIFAALPESLGTLGIVVAAPARYERYERVRRQLNAGAAFLHIREKVVWVDPAAPGPGKIPFWRLQRTYGPRWFLNPVCYLVLAVGLMSKAVWRRPATLG